jgi:hypothetical protein
MLCTATDIVVLQLLLFLLIFCLLLLPFMCHCHLCYFHIQHIHLFILFHFQVLLFSILLLCFFLCATQSQLITAKLVPTFHRIRFIAVHNRLSLVPSLNQIKPVQTLKNYFLKIHFNIILPYIYI